MWLSISFSKGKRRDCEGNLLMVQGVMSMQTSAIDKAVQVVSTLAIENIFLNSEAKKNLIAMVNKEKTPEDVIAELNKKYGR